MTDPIKILHCIVGMYGGGAERQLCYLARGLVERGMETHVALCRRGPNFRRLEASGAVVHEISARNLHSPWILAKVFRLAATLKPDVIQTWMVQMDIVGGITAKCQSVPWVLSERMGGSGLAYSPSIKHWLRRQVASGVSAIVSNSAAGDAYWSTRVSNRTTKKIIPNGLPIDEIRSVSPVSGSEIGVKQGDRVILCVGRLAPQKNHERVLLALRTVLNRIPAVVAVICGDGPERPKLERLVDTYGLSDRIVFAGYVENAWAWMKRASVLVHMSQFEGQPNAVMEGAACGCPIVASDIPEHREFLDESSASLVDPENTDQIAASIIEMLDLPLLAQEKAEAARSKANSWSVSVMVDRYVKTYRELVIGRKKPMHKDGSKKSETTSTYATNKL